MTTTMMAIEMVKSMMTMTNINVNNEWHDQNIDNDNDALDMT